MVIASGGIDESIAAANAFIDQANVALAALPSERARQGLNDFLTSLMAEFPVY